MTDPIADMLTRIRNAVTAKHTRVDMPSSRIKADIARILQDEGYIQGFKLLDETGAINKTLRLFLKYGPHGEKLITGVQRISRPGRRVYFGYCRPGYVTAQRQYGRFQQGQMTPIKARSSSDGLGLYVILCNGWFETCFFISQFCVCTIY